MGGTPAIRVSGHAIERLNERFEVGFDNYNAKKILRIFVKKSKPTIGYSQIHTRELRYFMGWILVISHDEYKTKTLVTLYRKNKWRQEDAKRVLRLL